MFYFFFFKKKAISLSHACLLSFCNEIDKLDNKVYQHNNVYLLISMNNTLDIMLYTVTIKLFHKEVNLANLVSSKILHVLIKARP